MNNCSKPAPVVMARATTLPWKRRRLRPSAGLSSWRRKAGETRPCWWGLIPRWPPLLIGPGGCHLEALEKMTRKTIFIRGQEDLSTEDVKVLAVGELSVGGKGGAPGERRARS